MRNRVVMILIHKNVGKIKSAPSGKELEELNTHNENYASDKPLLFADEKAEQHTGGKKAYRVKEKRKNSIQIHLPKG